MNSGMKAAAALAIGYVLGRRKKFRTATMMAAATAVGGTTVGGMVLKQGMKLVNSSDVLGKVAPQLGDITDTLKGDLFTAGKAAATAAVSNRLDSVTDSLHDRAERVRNPEAFVEEGVGGAAGHAGRAASRAGGAARRAGRGVTRTRDDEDYESDEADEVDDYEADDYEAEDELDDRQADEETDAAPPRRGTARRRSPVARARR
jgi:hypothetical protein